MLKATFKLISTILLITNKKSSKVMSEKYKHKRVQYKIEIESIKQRIASLNAFQKYKPFTCHNGRVSIKHNLILKNYKYTISIQESKLLYLIRIPG